MATTYLSSKKVGDIVYVEESGVAQQYLIIHKGLPGSMYDSSCDGVWVLRVSAHSYRKWDGTSGTEQNDYENSDIKTWLNETFLNTIDENIRSVIKTVKIPFKKGTGNAATGVQSGADGLSCKVFLLSGYEVGFTTSDNSYFPIDGIKLDYYLSGNDSTAQAKRIYKNSDGAAVRWYLRSADLTNDTHALFVSADGGYGALNAYCTYSIRPVFILPPELLLTSEGVVSTNLLPTITADKTGSLGELTDGFSCNYSVNDPDEADDLYVTLYMDDKAQIEFAANKEKNYSYTLKGEEWLKVTNGQHTFKIEVTDGKDTAESTTSFSRDCRKASLTLSSALAADDIIRFCSLKIKGALPVDTVLKCEVTNNANDSSPVWEDCTARVRSEMTYIFKNQTAENGFAFNFRISAERGSSGVGGYITTVCGGFE